MFDYRLLQFIVIYELDFIFRPEDIDDILVCNQNSLDFYNCVRNIFVKEQNNSIVLPYMKQIKSTITKHVHNYLKVVYEVDISIEDIKIPNNSGNLTNVVLMNNIEKNQYAEYAKKFISLNALAERVPNRNLPIELNDYNTIDEQKKVNYHHELYYFNGRFHTIILQNKKDKSRYLPIQFQMQFLWFYLSKQINLVLEKYYDTLLYDDSITKITEYSTKIDLVINKIELLNIFHQKFKLAIESDCEIYYLIEKRWNIENMIHSSNNYIRFFQDYLNRIYTRKTSKTEQRQNKILLFLALFQFIALISVWNDYLSLLDDDLAKKADEIIPLFGSYRMLENINLYLPLGFIVAILFMILYIYRYKDKER